MTYQIILNAPKDYVVRDIDTNKITVYIAHLHKLSKGIAIAEEWSRLPKGGAAI